MLSERRLVFARGIRVATLLAFTLVATSTIPAFSRAGPAFAPPQTGSHALHLSARHTGRPVHLAQLIPSDIEPVPLAPAEGDSSKATPLGRHRG
jgi:hypothetical protein